MFERFQIQLHKIFQNVVYNKESRYPAMEFIARLLITNEKRVQYQVEEKTVCTDGLMLNMLSVLQFLSVKVRWVGISKNVKGSYFLLCSLITFRLNWIK